MSIKILRQVWSLKIGSAEKVVLLALADMANDGGQAWVAVRSLKGKLDLLTMTCLGERTIQGAIKTLEREGYISRHETLGKGVNYDVHPTRETPARAAPLTPAILAPVTPAEVAPPQDLRPAKSAETPAGDAGYPYISPSSSSKTKAASNSKSKKRADEKIELPDWLPNEAWADFLHMRKVMRKPATVAAQRNIIKRIDEFRDRGADPRELLEKATVSNWLTVYEATQRDHHVRANGESGDIFEAMRTRYAGGGR